jgi:hypothetical protein
VIRGLLKDENDNLGAVCIVENVKAAARQSGVPWLIDAHSGKGEDQSDDADPSKALRVASSAAGAADYTLSSVDVMDQMPWILEVAAVAYPTS